MLYLANPTTCRPPMRVDAVKAAMSEGRLGCIATPAQGIPVPERAPWCADNGKFGKGWPGPQAWFAWLSGFVEKHGRETCLFATAPDEVGDARSTLEQSLPWLPRVRDLGVPVAFVAQDRSWMEQLVPWGEFDVLFLGGSTEFKLGYEGESLAWSARRRGVPVHMGRVNSLKRMRLAQQWGCATVDGTYLTYGPNINLPRLMSWHATLGLPNFEGYQTHERICTKGLAEDPSVLLALARRTN